MCSVGSQRQAATPSAHPARRTVPRQSLETHSRSEDPIPGARRLTRGRLANGRVSRDVEGVHGRAWPKPQPWDSPRCLVFDGSAHLTHNGLLGIPSTPGRGTLASAWRPCLPTPDAHLTGPRAGPELRRHPGQVCLANPACNSATLLRLSHPKLGFDWLLAGDSQRCRSPPGLLATWAPRLRGNPSLRLRVCPK